MRRELSVGDRIGNRYRIDEQVGRGGFTVVWKATDGRTGDTVAVKHPNYGAGKSEDAVEKYFGRELEALRTIERNGSHPNIMSLRETVVERGVQYMIVEFVAGEELERHGGIDDPDLVTDIGTQLCGIFSVLHDLEIVYRDLKPDNAMLTPDDDVVLIDFNTARTIPKCGNCGQKVDFDSSTDQYCPNPQCNTRLDRQTQIRAGPAGRSKYKPPEVKNADGIQGPWSDVYSIGKLLYFLATGLVTAHPMDDPRGRIDCPDYLADIVVRATALEPINRYRNAGVMRYCLEQRDADAHKDLPEAVLTNVETGEKYTVAPGDTIGRENASGPFPTIGFEDDDQIISRVHAKFDFDGDQWVIVDKSTNGTVIDASDPSASRLPDWDGILQRESWDGQPGEAPPQYATLDDLTVIGVPRPDRGVRLQFSRQ
ncbi:serine/threonine protein kinase [Halobellus rufus]|uniref:serine/threonine protein kinase n=1 Tax=Halobellus rufus TaxID=1448860 RepID=UPI0006791448|nr:FHA domain-containing serine/threonine-protein kinase [Halobellus rufus]